MIKGIGIDIVEVDRIRRSIEKEKGFRELVFSTEEVAYCEANTHKYQHYAARFAAKEAFFKALGTGWKSGTAFNEIFVLNDELGKPFLQIRGASASSLGENFTQNRIFLSLSHTSVMATAIVVIETI